MPGILPMKVIKVGNSAQSRIAQACDRCRSKKIRCDGVRPTCSQCANVGFECKTSDKLSRRAFPRGYTESLEERVRALEAEVRELKDLLDEKDEKIDMLSAMHNSRRRPSVTAVATVAQSPERSKESPKPKEDTFKVQASPLLLGVENSDAYFMGSSSGRAFIAAFKRKIQETGKPCAEFNPEAFLHMQGCPPLAARLPESSVRVPPRMFSDRCVNVYFQEWAPLFPALHKPSFLRLYEEFVADPEKVRNKHKIAQLYLVFSLAGLSSSSPDLHHLASCEKQWTEALDGLLLDNTMSTLQCLLLALLYFTLTADYRRLQHYKSIAVGLAQRLGLHQSQKRFSFGALTLETRKKVFWTLYTIDCFSAASLGLPRLFKEDDVQVELPSDTDDEYITEKGFQPTLPGEHTRLSSALALFGAARVLAAVLDQVYPAATSYDLSLSQLRALEAELDSWYDGLPGHLKLNFKQDKPSTDVTGSRSPLLALAYFYIRGLIHRPVITSGLGSKAAPSLLAVADSSKRIIQITELLEERSLSFSFCANRGDVLALCAMSLLYRAVDLKPASKLMRDDERLVNSVIKTLDNGRAAGSIELRKIASMLISVEGSPRPPASPTARKSSASSPGGKSSSSSHSRKKSSSGSSSHEKEAHHKERGRRMTMPEVTATEPLFTDNQGRQSFDSATSDPTLTTADPLALQQMAGSHPMFTTMIAARQNLDYLSLGNTPSASRPGSPGKSRQQSAPSLVSQAGNNAMAAKMAGVSSSEWEALLGSMDGGMNNVYHAIYGGSALSSEPSLSNKCNDWSPDSWDLTSFNIGDLNQNGGDGPQSVLSLSDESLSSGEEVAPSELGLSVGSVEYANYGQSVRNGTVETYSMEGLDGFLL